MLKNPHQKKKLDDEFLTFYVERKKIAGKEASAGLNLQSTTDLNIQSLLIYTSERKSSTYIQLLKNLNMY